MFLLNLAKKTAGWAVLPVLLLLNPAFGQLIVAVPAVTPPALETTPYAPKRVVTLHELFGPEGQTEILFDGKSAGWVAQQAVPGSTEDWEIINLTSGTLLLHLHLQYQLVNRQPFYFKGYLADWLLLNEMPPLFNDSPVTQLDPLIYLREEPMEPEWIEMGWNEPIRANLGEVTRIKVTF